ncbi:MAG TPA: hypothetical protein VFL82_04065 [Thermomicrobiales bacterium]|nr:hypothetical protein [Thermomicrobiales bacterium]
MEELRRSVGREHETAAVGALVRDPIVCLVTLTGPGGVGQIRLALSIARDVADQFTNCVTFIALAPVPYPALDAACLAVDTVTPRRETPYRV